MSGTKVLQNLKLLALQYLQTWQACAHCALQARCALTPQGARHRGCSEFASVFVLVYFCTSKASTFVLVREGA